MTGQPEPTIHDAPASPREPRPDVPEPTPPAVSVGDTPTPPGAVEIERKIDEAVEESFPASDPPAWSPGTL